MDKQCATSAHYAILIGINYCKHKPLKGAIRDVHDIKTHLEEALQPVHIRMFTASESTDPKLSSPLEDQRLRPTLQDVTSTFDEITKLPMPGDSVYIHYSGHGTREEPSVKSYNPTGDVALFMPTGNKENPETYLFGRILAYYLNAMVMKEELVVTLVLYCCFLASVYRSDDRSIRFLPYDLEIGSKARENLTSEFVSLGSRDVSMRPNWLVNQDKYAILVACGLDEKAIEPKFADGQIHGALSYVLLRILKEESSLIKNIKDIYGCLKAEFWRLQLHQYQRPVRYGNSNQGVFGLSNLEVFVPTYIVNKKCRWQS